MATRQRPDPPPQDGPRTLKALPQPAAAQPPRVTLAVARAMRALRDGNASEHQQKMALEWIVAEACAKRHFAYYPSARDTALMPGPHFAGEQNAGLFHVDLASLKEG